MKKFAKNIPAILCVQKTVSNLGQLEHISTRLPHCCHFGDNRQVVNHKTNLKGSQRSVNYSRNQELPHIRSSNLSLLVARQSLRMSKKTKASNVCSCVCVVLVHEPGGNEWLKANFLRHCLPGAPGRGSVKPCHTVHGALIGFPHILLTYLEKGLEVITTTKNESSHPKMRKSLQVIFE